jgi:DNA mismatch endonuclease (patch repair protein)
MSLYIGVDADAAAIYGSLRSWAYSFCSLAQASLYACRAELAREMAYPRPASSLVTAAMRRNRKKGTRPEMLVRRFLRNAGYNGYRLHWSVPGTPDIAFPGRHIAVFVQGCFWHRCPRCDIAVPRNNAEYWGPKFRRNVERDRDNVERLKRLGWRVITIWECDVLKLREASIKALLKVLASSLNRARPRL